MLLSKAPISRRAGIVVGEDANHPFPAEKDQSNLTPTYEGLAAQRSAPPAIDAIKFYSIRINGLEWRFPAGAISL